jgi:hypothetical protein
LGWPRALRNLSGDGGIGLRPGSSPAPPGPDSEDEQHGIGPKHQSGAVSPREQRDIDGLQHMPEYGRQLKAGYPQRPEAVGSQSDPKKTGKDQDVYDHQIGFEGRKSLPHGRQSELRREDTEDEDDANVTLVTPPTQNRVKRDEHQQNSE